MDYIRKFLQQASCDRWRDQKLFKTYLIDKKRKSGKGSKRGVDEVSSVDEMMFLVFIIS